MFCSLEYMAGKLLGDIDISITASDRYNIPESVVTKALMIAMNYLMENMETDDEESAE